MDEEAMEEEAEREDEAIKVNEAEKDKTLCKPAVHLGGQEEMKFHCELYKF